MSADAWSQCPRCVRRNVAEIENEQSRVDALYGAVSVEEFDRAREMLVKDRQALANMPETFREDYEFYGAEDGIVVAAYSGECTKCGLKLKFVEPHPIPGVNE